jgi:hypothetical protein
VVDWRFVAGRLTLEHRLPRIETRSVLRCGVRASDFRCWPLADHLPSALLSRLLGADRTLYAVLRSSNWATLAPLRNAAQSFINARRFSNFWPR